MNIRVLFVVLLQGIIACNYPVRQSETIDNCDTIIIKEKTIVQPVVKENTFKLVKNVNDSLTHYHLKQAVSMAYSAEGSTISGYYSNEKLKKVTALHYGETGKALESFYFNKDTLFYYERFNTIYEAPIYINKKAKVNKESTEKYYFSNMQLVFIEIPDTIAELDNKRHQILLNMSRYFEELNKPQ